MQHWSAKSAAIGVVPLFLATGAATGGMPQYSERTAIQNASRMETQANRANVLSESKNSSAGSSFPFADYWVQISSEVSRQTKVGSSSNDEIRSRGLVVAPPVFSAIEDLRRVDDAVTFMQLLQGIEWRPNVWADDGELAFEWIADGKHAIVSFEGDGRMGYTILRDGAFVSGETPDPPVTILPPDLMEYLTVA